MLSPFDSIFLGIVQGLTEFLPISSSGHLILAREVLGISQAGGLAFDAMLQLATALAVVLYFRTDIADLVRNLFSKTRDAAKTRLTWYLVVGTVPAVVLGLALEEYMETLFRSSKLVALTLVVGAVIMFAADRALAWREQAHGLQDEKPATKDGTGLTATKAVGVGLFQALALVPGMSRSGMTISGGYFLGLPKDLAIRFSFLLSIPVIVGSGLVKLPDLVKETAAAGSGAPSLVLGFLSAFAFGWFAIDFLLKFLRNNSFTGFVIYRIALALILAVVFW